MTADQTLDPYVARACELGALDAKVIAPASVVTAPWVRLKCQYGCGCYNTNLCCPPHSPDHEQTRRVLDSYGRALLIHGKDQARLKDVVSALEREVFLAGHYKAFAFGAGPCFLCGECGRQRCARPHEARPAMESCGIDVFATAHANGFTIRVATDPDGDRDHFVLLLVD